LILSPANGFNAADASAPLGRMKHHNAARQANLRRFPMLMKRTPSIHNVTSWRYSVGQRIRYLTSEQAANYLARIRVRGNTIDQPAIRELTGGYVGQSINHYVIRRLNAKAIQQQAAT
jgi:hypothetical protein